MQQRKDNLSAALNKAVPTGDTLQSYAQRLAVVSVAAHGKPTPGSTALASAVSNLAGAPIDLTRFNGLDALDRLSFLSYLLLSGFKGQTSGRGKDYSDLIRENLHKIEDETQEWQAMVGSFNWGQAKVAFGRALFANFGQSWINLDDPKIVQSKAMLVCAPVDILAQFAQSLTLNVAAHFEKAPVPKPAGLFIPPLQWWFAHRPRDEQAKISSAIAGLYEMLFEKIGLNNEDEITPHSLWSEHITEIKYVLDDLFTTKAKLLGLGSSIKIVVEGGKIKMI